MASGRRLVPDKQTMQTLLLPAARSGVAPPASLYKAALSKPPSCNATRGFLRFSTSPYPHSSLSSLKFLQSLSSPFIILRNQSNHSAETLASAPTAAAYTSPSDESEKAKLAQVTLSLSPLFSASLLYYNFLFIVD